MSQKSVALIDHRRALHAVTVQTEVLGEVRLATAKHIKQGELPGDTLIIIRPSSWLGNGVSRKGCDRLSIRLLT